MGFVLKLRLHYILFLYCCFSNNLNSQETSEKKNVLPVPLIQNSAGKARSFTKTSIGLQIIKNELCLNKKLTFELVTPAKHGLVVLPEYDIHTGASVNFNYISNRDFVGVDSFVWRINNGQQASNLATVTITVYGDNPIPDPSSMIHVIENKSKVFEASYSGGNADITYSILYDKPNKGKIEVEGLSFKYTPNENFEGDDAFNWWFSIKSISTGKTWSSKKGSYTILESPKF